MQTSCLWGKALVNRRICRGEPFVGPAGQLLDDMLCIIDLGRHNCYIANIVKVPPSQKPGPYGD